MWVEVDKGEAWTKGGDTGEKGHEIEDGPMAPVRLPLTLGWARLPFSQATIAPMSALPSPTLPSA